MGFARTAANIDHKELFAHARRLKKEKSEIDDELLDKRDAIQTVRRSLEKAKKEIDSLQDEKVSWYSMFPLSLGLSVLLTSKAKENRIGTSLHWL